MKYNVVYISGYGYLLYISCCNCETHILKVSNVGIFFYLALTDLCNLLHVSCIL